MYIGSPVMCGLPVQTTVTESAKLYYIIILKFCKAFLCRRCPTPYMDNTRSPGTGVWLFLEERRSSLQFGHASSKRWRCCSSTESNS